MDRHSSFFLILVFLLAAAAPLRAEVIDRTVAFVNDDAILLSDLDNAYQKTHAIDPSITKDDVLQTLINRKVLLQDAQKFFPGPQDEDLLLKEYIDLKVRAYIRVPEQEVRAYYDRNKAKFDGLPYEKARDQIETLLEEREVNRKLASQIADLRARAWIKVFPPPGGFK